jgi:autotransporter-associated beta strand protein
MNGGTINSSGTGKYNNDDFQLEGKISVVGTTPSTIALANGMSINTGGSFDVLDPAGKLTVAAGIHDRDGGASPLVKDGPGVLTLTGALSYTGNTTVTGGTLNVNTLSTPTATVAVYNSSALNANSLACNSLTIGGSSAAAVPEPAIIVLLAIGLASILGPMARKTDVTRPCSPNQESSP